MKYISCWYYQQSIGNLFERAEVRFWDYSKFWSGAPTVFGWKFVFNGRTLEKYLIHIYGKNTCRWKVSLWRQIWWNRWPLKRKQQGHRHISHNHHHSPLFEILVEQGIQRSSDHSRRRGPVFGENEVSQIFWERDKVSKQTLNSNYVPLNNMKNCYEVRLMRWWGGRTHISFQSWSPNQPRLSRWMGWRTDEWGRIRTGGNPI